MSETIKFFNYTDSDIVLRGTRNGVDYVKREFPMVPGGIDDIEIKRKKISHDVISEIDGIPIIKERSRENNEIIGLPEPKDGVFYIVEQHIAKSGPLCDPPRHDLVCVDWDEVHRCGGPTNTSRFKIF